MYKGKKFLLTHIWLRGFSGAEINILELASYLHDQGAEVEVFTLYTSEPMLSIFQEKGIQVIDDIEYQFNVSDFDYVWVSQNLLPNKFIRSLGTKQVKLPKFLFLHMAALPEHVIEQPFIHQLENQISSGTLAISKEVVKYNLNRYFASIPNLMFYQNPAPQAYFDKRYRHKIGKLKRIIVISNHPPKEIIELGDYFKELDVTVDYYGVWTDNYELVTPSLISQYDCLIGIGKNIQYALSMGKPVYVYDHFGGPGFLTEDNFDIAEEYNFSGRCFSNRKDSLEIVNEIVSQFSESQEFYSTFGFERAKQKYSIAITVSNILKQVDLFVKDISIFDEYYVNYLLSMNELLKNSLVRLDNDVKNLWEQIRLDKLEIHKQIEEKMSIEKKHHQLEKEYSELNQELTLLKVSRFYKLSQIYQSLKHRIHRKG